MRRKILKKAALLLVIVICALSIQACEENPQSSVTTQEEPVQEKDIPDQEGTDAAQGQSSEAADQEGTAAAAGSTGTDAASGTSATTSSETYNRGIDKDESVVLPELPID